MTNISTDQNIFFFTKINTQKYHLWVIVRAHLKPIGHAYEIFDADPDITARLYFDQNFIHI